MDAHRASEDITGSPISQLSGITVVSDTPTTVHVHTRLSTVSEEHPTPETTVHEQGQASQDEDDVPWEKPDWKHPSKDDLLNDHGLLSVACLQRVDKTFGFTLAHHGAANLVQHFLDIDIIQKEKQIIYAVQNGVPISKELRAELTELVDKKTILIASMYLDKFMFYHKFVLGLETPTKSMVGQLKQYAEDQLGPEGARYLPDDPKDYAIMSRLSKLEIILRNVAITAIGEFFCEPLLNRVIHRGVIRQLQYSSWGFQLFSRTVLTCFFAAIFCVPVIIQASGAVSRAGSIAAFGVVVTVGGFIMNVLFPDIKTTTMLTIALAALLSNCLKSD